MTTQGKPPQSAATRGTPNQPPAWWARWRPLRWLAALLALVVIGLLARAWWPQKAPAPTAPASASVAAPTPSAPAAGPAPGAAPPAEEPITVDGVRAAYMGVVPEAQRLSFFPPFRSYAGVDEVYKALEQAHYAPQLSSRHAKVPEGVPPSDLDLIEVDDYQHLDQPGKLELQFFNDRLYQIEFQPRDPDAYRPLFRRQWPQLRHEKSGRSEYVSGALRIASSLDLSVSEVGQILHTRPFVLWQDLRLVRQRDDWNYQFAREVAP
ncbi:hypothetical protein [Solimonas soli]|uniref:hypothetical protein n=1 Tax=Solimonas soli TaxID=413479 RepID=UPI00047FAD3D|nr:hypothetical protein [Solimonas soli]